jgi:hypothetical protein
VDGVTWQEYEVGLEDRLIDLHDRVHRGAYRATPSRSVEDPGILVGTVIVDALGGQKSRREEKGEN